MPFPSGVGACARQEERGSKGCRRPYKTDGSFPGRCLIVISDTMAVEMQGNGAEALPDIRLHG